MADNLGTASASAFLSAAWVLLLHFPLSPLLPTSLPFLTPARKRLPKLTPHSIIAPDLLDPLHPTCMVIINFLAALDTDSTLPGKPPGPFALSDSMTLREMLSGTAAPYLECVRRGALDPQGGGSAFGWAQMGE